jgi:hypothetical protein
MQLVTSDRMTVRDFGSVFAKLAMQYRERDADEATIRAYYEALSKYPLEAVRMAAERLSTEPGRKWLPTTGEWSEAILAAQAAIAKATLTHVRREPWKVECLACDDTGWVDGLTCDGGAEVWPEHYPKEKRGVQGPQFRGNARLVGYVAQERRTDTPRRASCGKERPHAPHAYTRVCSCRPTNRTFQRNQRFGKGE